MYICLYVSLENDKDRNTAKDDKYPPFLFNPSSQERHLLL